MFISDYVPKAFQSAARGGLLGVLARSDLHIQRVSRSGGSILHAAASASLPLVLTLPYVEHSCGTAEMIQSLHAAAPITMPSRPDAVHAGRHAAGSVCAASRAPHAIAQPPTDR